MTLYKKEEYQPKTKFPFCDSRVEEKGYAYAQSVCLSIPPVADGHFQSLERSLNRNALVMLPTDFSNLVSEIRISLILVDQFHLLEPAQYVIA